MQFFTKLWHALKACWSPAVTVAEVVQELAAPDADLEPCSTGYVYQDEPVAEPERPKQIWEMTCSERHDYIRKFLEDQWSGVRWDDNGPYAHFELQGDQYTYSDDALTCDTIDTSWETPLILRGDLLRAKRSLDRVVKYLLNGRHEDDAKRLSPAFEIISAMLNQTKDLERYATPETSLEAPVIDSDDRDPYHIGIDPNSQGVNLSPRRHR